jgi:hypothetical protein
MTATISLTLPTFMARPGGFTWRNGFPLTVAPVLIDVNPMNGFDEWKSTGDAA